MLVKNLIIGCIFLAFAGSATSRDALPSGVMEGHLKILSSKPVDIGDENAATVAAGNYADYPLLVLSRDKQKEIARVTADTNGNYRAVLPPATIFSSRKGGRASTQNRNHSRSCPIKLSTSIW